MYVLAYEYGAVHEDAVNKQIALTRIIIFVGFLVLLVIDINEYQSWSDL